MKLIVAGSRSIKSVVEVYIAIEACKFDRITEIVSGKAKGVDTIGEQYALEYNIPITEFPANWSKYGKAAGQIRNKEMADYADALVAVWDGYSKGTAGMITIMRKLNKPVYVKLVQTNIPQVKN